MPYLGPICAAFDDLVTTIVTVVMGSQMGKTEAILNLLGHCCADQPAPCLYVGPSEKQVKTIARDRLDSLIKGTPMLQGLQDPRSTHQGTYERYINGARLGFAWAGSATELASTPNRLALVDERDRMGSDVKGEGDPVELCRARVQNYYGGTTGIFSTPLVQGASPVWSWFLAGTREIWYPRCIECGEHFKPERSLLMWDESAEDVELIASTVVACPNCGAEHPETQFKQCSAAGRFVPHRIAVKDTLEPDFEASTRRVIRSFWVHGLCSPLVTIGKRAHDLVLAEQSGEEERIQGVINTRFGELYKLEGVAPPDEAVLTHRAAYDLERMSAEIVCVVAGVDVHHGNLRVVVRAFGRALKSWLALARELPGDTDYDEVWLTLRRITSARYGGHPVLRTLIDSGDRTDRVYWWCRRVPGWVPCKGMEKLPAAQFEVKPCDRRWDGKRMTSLLRYDVNTSFFKGWIHARVRQDPEHAQWWLNGDATEQYAEEICGEEYTLHAGEPKWVEVPGRHNHWLDCEVYTTCAAWTLGIDQVGRGEQDELPPLPPEEVAEEGPGEASLPPVSPPVREPEPSVLRHHEARGPRRFRRRAF